MEEEREKSFTKRISELIEQYAKTSFEIYKLKAANAVAGALAGAITGVALWVIFLMLLLFLSIGAAFYLGRTLGGYHYGFFIIAGVYLILGIVIFLSVKSLKIAIGNKIIGEIFKDGKR